MDHAKEGSQRDKAKRKMEVTYIKHFLNVPSGFPFAIKLKMGHHLDRLHLFETSWKVYAYVSPSHQNQWE